MTALPGTMPGMTITAYICDTCGSRERWDSMDPPPDTCDYCRWRAAQRQAGHLKPCPDCGHEIFDEEAGDGGRCEPCADKHDKALLASVRDVGDIGSRDYDKDDPPERQRVLLPTGEEVWM